MILGLDVSHWNYPVNWSQWTDRAYVWIKCTEGTNWPDPKYIANTAEAKQEGLLTGPYHYFRAAWSGSGQAKHFHETSNLGPTHLPPAVDVERRNNLGFSKSVFRARLKEMLDGVEERFGQKPIIYTSKYAWQELVGQAGWESDYALWVAHYTSASQPLLPNGWDDWDVWQHTSVPLDQNRMKLEYWHQITGPPPQKITVELPIDVYNGLKEALDNV